MEIPKREIKEILEVVRGNTVRTRNFVRDIGAGLKNLIGGEIKAYTEMIAQSREEAFHRMVQKAEEINADAIIGVRFITSMVMQGASEMVAYGTAVKLNNLT